MFRRVEDFLASWKRESESTRRVFSALTDESLGQKVTPEGRSVGQLAWHLTLTLGEMMGQTGLKIDGPAEDVPVPARASEIHDSYARGSNSIGLQVKQNWSDSMLDDELEMYGQKWTRRDVLASLILHEAHHRGQMTVLMRQAGLRVPGIYGPAREEWAQFNMPAPW